jgi:hypothetical protein
VTIGRYILVACNVILWGGFAWIGWRGMDYIQSQHAAGYPSFGQVAFYVIVPLVILIAGLIPALILWHTKAARLGTAWALCSLVPFLPYACLSGGGI